MKNEVSLQLKHRFWGRIQFLSERNILWIHSKAFCHLIGFMQNFNALQKHSISENILLHSWKIFVSLDKILTNALKTYKKWFEYKYLLNFISFILSQLKGLNKFVKKSFEDLKLLILLMILSHILFCFELIFLFLK